MTEHPDQAEEKDQRRPASLADMVAVSAPVRSWAGIKRGTGVKIAVLALLFTALNGWQFRELIGQWRKPDWSHGFIIPLFSLYLLYSRQEEIFGAKARVNMWGLGILVLGVLTMIYSFYPIGNHWMCQLSMIEMLFGLVLYLGGRDVVRFTWLPIAYLMLAMPVPAIYYARIAVPLQEVAASSSTLLLRLFGVHISVAASNLQIVSVTGNTYPLTVAEACSGVRSLMAFIALGVAMAYLEPRPMWQRAVLVASTLPITVACNVIRVTITCAMFVVDRPEYGRDFMHAFVGLLLLIPALGMLLLLSWLIRKLFPGARQRDHKGAGPRGKPRPSPSATPRPDNSRPGPGPRRRRRMRWQRRVSTWMAGNRHFVIASVILGVSAVGWGGAIYLLEWATHKMSVPWPDQVAVTKEGRLTSLPVRIGPYRRCRDGELGKDGQKDGEPDGEITYRKDVRETLGINSLASQLEARRGNWYIDRVYVDTRASPGGGPPAYPVWRLSVTFYTGDLDKVPHVPERCLNAAGAQVRGTDKVDFSFIGPPGWAGWHEKLAFNRTRSIAAYSGQRNVDYYVFALNGEPTRHWETVRWTLSRPWKPYCYFAKIQFSPLTSKGVGDLKTADKAAEEFLEYVLPEVLKSLPTVADVERQELSD